METKTWLITGASRGLGLAIAKAALAHGVNTVLTSRQASTDEGLLAMDAGRCLSLDHDAGDTRQSAGIIARATQAFGAVDVLVLNAGQGLVSAVEETPEAEERRIMDLMFHGPMSLIRAILPSMRERGSGHIVVISAAAVHGNYAGFSAYGAAKAALECACEALRAEVQGFGLHVALVIPGPFRTEFIESAPRPPTSVYASTVGRFAGILERMAGRQPGDPARAADIIVRQIMSQTMPFRLPLGAYAAKKLKDRGTAFQREAEALDELSRSADHSGA
jgi:NAD(P)-dependent dehydrogenase (short-subunit alcohol dehydrogenase family)